MEQQTYDPGTSGDTARKLERYADRSRPPAPWVYVVAGVLLGTAIALVGILPEVWGALPVVLIGVAGLGHDRWLVQRHGVPRLRELPAAVWREQLALIVVAIVVGMLPLVLAQVVAAFSVAAGMVTVGIGVAVLLGIGGPIVDRRARATAAALLDDRRRNGTDPGV